MSVEPILDGLLCILLRGCKKFVYNKPNYSFRKSFQKRETKKACGVEKETEILAF